MCQNEVSQSKNLKHRCLKLSFTEIPQKNKFLQHPEVLIGKKWIVVLIVHQCNRLRDQVLDMERHFILELNLAFLWKLILLTCSVNEKQSIKFDENISGKPLNRWWNKLNMFLVGIHLFILIIYYNIYLYYSKFSSYILNLKWIKFYQFSNLCNEFIN